MDDQSPVTILNLRDERSRRAIQQTIDIINRAGRLTLSKFITLAWHVVEPSRDYVPGWHIDALCEHLEAVADGRIKRLAIAVPPGAMKSLLTCVFYPAWLWGPQGRPSERIITFSHDTTLSTRDALRCRRLMTSSWYQRLWGSIFALAEDANVKTRYENSETGFRISDYVGGGTGDRGDLLVVDDPHQVKDTESDAMRARALLWFHETLPTRLVDPSNSAIIVIHHRIHERDMIGEILACELEYEYICLPMEFETDRRCKTSIGWEDPRQTEGELLFPARFPREVVERDKRAMGSYAYSGQMQQAPTPRGGGMFKRQWFDIVPAAPVDCYWARHWDLAATVSADAAFTAGVLVGKSRSTGMFYVGDVVRGQMSGAEVKRLIAQTSALDVMRLQKRNYTISLPQDAGQAGKVQAQDFVAMLAGYDVFVDRESGDKETRARPFAAQMEAGNVKLLAGKWNEAYISELVSFPTGRFKDQVDASSGAFGCLVMRPKQTMFVGSVVGQY